MSDYLSAQAQLYQPPSPVLLIPQKPPPLCENTAAVIPKPDNPREIRNKAEKQRRDKLNHSISELASIVPPVVAASRKIDKTGILRLTAHYLRAHQYVFGDSIGHSAQEFGAESTKAILGLLRGFLITTTYRGLVVVVSQNVQQYLGYTELDLLGQNIFTLTHLEDHETLKQNLTPQSHMLGRNGELLVPEEPDGDQKVADALAREKRRFVVRFKKLSLKSEPIQYVPCTVEGCFRKSDHARPGFSLSRVVRRARARENNPCASGNDIVFVGIVRPVTETFMTERTLESFKMEYKTRHSIDGEIMECEHRIALVTGYMTHEVNGVNAMNFMHKDDVRWVVIALREMYDQHRLVGESCYRLMTKNGQFIYMRTRGRLDVDENSRAVRSFVCINTVVEETEGKHLIQMMKKKFMLMVNNNEEPPEDDDSEVTESDLPVEDPRSLEKVILHLVTNLPSPQPDISNESPQHGEPPTHPLAIIPPKKERIISAIEKIYGVINIFKEYNVEYDMPPKKKRSKDNQQGSNQEDGNENGKSKNSRDSVKYDKLQRKRQSKCTKPKVDKQQGPNQEDRDETVDSRYNGPAIQQSNNEQPANLPNETQRSERRIFVSGKPRNTHVYKPIPFYQNGLPYGSIQCCPVQNAAASTSTSFPSSSTSFGYDRSSPYNYRVSSKIQTSPKPVKSPSKSQKAHKCRKSSKSSSSCSHTSSPITYTATSTTTTESYDTQSAIPAVDISRLSSHVLPSYISYNSLSIMPHMWPYNNSFTPNISCPLNQNQHYTWSWSSTYHGPMPEVYRAPEYEQPAHLREDMPQPANDLPAYQPEHIPLPDYELPAYQPEHILQPANDLPAYQPEPIPQPASELPAYQPEHIPQPANEFLAYQPEHIPQPANELLAYQPEHIPQPASELLAYQPEHIPQPANEFLAYQPEHIPQPANEFLAYQPEHIPQPANDLPAYQSKHIPQRDYELSAYQPEYILQRDYELSAYQPEHIPQRDYELPAYQPEDMPQSVYEHSEIPPANIPQPVYEQSADEEMVHPEEPSQERNDSEELCQERDDTWNLAMPQPKMDNEFVDNAPVAESVAQPVAEEPQEDLLEYICVFLAQLPTNRLILNERFMHQLIYNLIEHISGD